MKKSKENIIIQFLLLIVFVTMSNATKAQVKVSNNNSVANADAMLEIESANKGFLLPRLALVSTTQPTPLNNFVKGMLVYDTATINDITPGIYYSDGTKWERVSNSTGISSGLNAWSLVGNTGTTSSNFIGTTDNKDVLFKTNSLERVRITKDGWVGIGTVNPQAALQIKGQLIIDTLTTGDITTDKILVADANGKIKSVFSTVLTSSVQKKIYYVALAGQTNFVTPFNITDIDKVFLYRNGVLINFSIFNINTIIAEIACSQFDEIKIVQIL